MDRALIIAGPTCSGKSALAMALAERFQGVVINADSMQVYRELRIVTARPSAADEARVPHSLYGVRAASSPGSAGWWREAALDAMDAARRAGRVPILCGGTGLYLSALVRGIAPVPDPGAAARQEARTLLVTEGAAALHARLAVADPATAAGLRPSDPQRIARAWEVWRGTGRGLLEWQRDAVSPPGWRFGMMLLNPARDTIRAGLEARFRGMVEAGALEEVAALLALGLDPTLPAIRAVGVPELAAVLRGELTLEAGIVQAVAASSRYVKRQATWFRHRPPVVGSHVHMIHARFARLKQFSERDWAFIERFVIC